MPIVYVQTVKLQNIVHFLLDRFSNSFNSKHLENFADIVTCRTNRVHVSLAQHLHH